MAAGAVASSPKRSKKPFIIAAVVVALLAVGGGAGYYFGIYAPEQAREAAEQEALAAKHAVRFAVSAEGWDTSAGASRLPLHITGKEARGKKVDVVRYVDSTGAGVELRRGSYKAEVAASPIAADGTIYAVPGEKVDVKVSKKAEGKKSIDAGNVSLAPVEATEVTDDEIAAAKKYAEEDAGAKKAGFSFDADALAQTATKRRDDAVAAKQAEEEARRQAEEARQARTIETDDCVMVLPDWFPIDEYKVTKTDYQYGWTVNITKGEDDTDAIHVDLRAYDPKNVGGFGTTGNAMSEKIGVASSGNWVFIVTMGGTDQTRPLGLSQVEFCKTLASCVTLK
ncbi:MAG: hypothetical protein ACLTEP_00120 [Collinsella sp.]